MIDSRAGTDWSFLLKWIQPNWTIPSELDPADADGVQIQALQICNLEENSSEYAWLIEQCPNLRRLIWVVTKPNQELEALTQMRQLADWVHAADSTCQYLEDLALPGSKFKE